MKKWVCFLGMALCFWFCAGTARADVIWTPMDSFYEEHEDECTYVNRQYTADGPDGVVILYESPESSKVIATWENGRQVYISFTYEDERGIVWGISDEEETGWMPMEYMKVVYDSISFAEDYGDQIVSQTGALDEQYQNETVFFWKYPGAENGSSMNLGDWEYLPEYGSVYVDETGHSWGYIGYYYGYRSVWVCLDAPTADYAALYPDGAPQIGKDDEAQPQGSGEPGAASESQGAGEPGAASESQDQAGGRTERITPKTNDRTVVVVVVLVVLVVLATAVLLVILKKRR